MQTAWGIRRLFRFSLRAVFVLVAVVAIVLAWVHGARDQQRAVGELQKSNPSATVLYGDEVDADGRRQEPADPPGPAWLRERFGADYFSTVAGAEMFYATDADLKRVARLPNLRRLCLERSIDVTDAGLAHLEGLGKLRLLVLDDADQVTDAGLRSIGRLKSLVHVQLDFGRRMTSAGIEQLQRDLPGCRVEVLGLEGDERLAESTRNDVSG